MVLRIHTSQLLQTLCSLYRKPYKTIELWKTSTKYRKQSQWNKAVMENTLMRVWFVAKIVNAVNEYI